MKKIAIGIIGAVAAVAMAQGINGHFDKKIKNKITNLENENREDEIKKAKIIGNIQNVGALILGGIALGLCQRKIEDIVSGEDEDELDYDEVVIEESEEIKVTEF